MKKIFTLILFLSLFFLSCQPTANQVTNLSYQQVDEEQPLKGFLPFISNRTTVPHSMEFFYIPLKDLTNKKGVYDFTPIEENLTKISGRGHQAIFRVYLEYPKRECGTPDYFFNQGIKKIYYKYSDGNTYYFPDYTNQKCIDMLCDFIKELGKKYDGDNRIGFINAGLIGHWGEWHNTYYYFANNYTDSKMPSDDQQNQLFTTYSENFKKTFVLTRIPTTKYLADFKKIGFHDDSFTEDTIDVNNNKSYYFLTSLKRAGLTERWMTAPIGGEFRPENQVPFLKNKKYASYYQDYDECVAETHCSWLLYDAAFYNERTKSERKVAWKSSKKLGYDLTVSEASAKINGTNLDVTLVLENKGVAKFYYNWSPNLVLVKDGAKKKSFPNKFQNWNLTKLGPGEKKSFEGTFPLEEAFQNLEGYQLCFQIKNPMEGGIPLKLANHSLNKNLKGFVTLAEF